MPQIAQLGSINIAALNVPDIIVQIVPPQLLINGIPSNVVGFVGTASWGPANVAQVVGGYQGAVVNFGAPNARKYDLVTAVWAASQQGAQAFRLVRVTDGTDTAAAVTIQTNCLTVTALYTGTVGNSLNFSLGYGSGANVVINGGVKTVYQSTRAVVSLPGQVAEVFDNISPGVVGFTVTPGVYTVCPSLLTIAAPVVSTGTTAIVYPQLAVNYGPLTAGASFTTSSASITLASAAPTWLVAGMGVWDTTAAAFVGKVASVGGSTVTLVANALVNSSGSADSLTFGPAVQVGGTGYVLNDTVTLANGVTVKVLAVTSGAITAVSVVNAGSVPAGQTAPTNPVAQTSTTGSGTGATFNLSWGLGTPILGNGGTGYYGTAPTVTIVGGTESVAGTVTANTSIWTNLANAINNGISGLRGPSQFVSATAGVGTSAPTLQGYTLSGGTDGANPSSIGQTGAPALVGQDSLPRTGMYAMRSSLVAIGALVDCDDPTTWTTQVSFGSSEGIYMIATGPNGENLTTATGANGNRAQYGIDNFTIKIMFGDWVYINDPVTGAQRMISPQGFVAGFMGNQDPSQTPMNKEMNGIVATQKSMTGIQYTNADLQALSAACLDVICNPNPGGAYFGLRLGINSSSNLAVNGDNYTRMTYFIARTIAQGCGFYVGQLQTQTERLQAMTTLAAFFQELLDDGLIGTPDGSPCYQVVLNDSNNPFNLVALGYQTAYCKVTYLSVIRYFIIDLEGGQTVQILNELPTGAVPLSGGTITG